MNLLERIDRLLDDTRARLHPLDFEDCATSLLSIEHPGLAPVTGGTDYGLDAEIAKPDGDVIGLIITSSRTWEGARKSLRDSLKSARQHKRPVRQVMVANLAEVNRQRREKLKGIAEEFDCALIQVYDRAWFANTFLANPDWREKILGIRGGAFSLSRESRGARPDERHLPTVGRDELLELASHADEDLVFWGVPGAGKSHVAGRLPGALFLERNTPPERLLDDLLSTSPDLVVVDDAGARTDDLDALLHARQAENLKFRVVATCWTQEVDNIGDHLPGALRLEVDLLTREEIGTLLRERGITKMSVLVNLLEQAQGRPAWALNLADLLVRHADWQSVWTGQALREQIVAFLRRSRAPQEAIELLAAIALVGEANEDQARTLAGLFQLRPVEFQNLIRSVAIAGLVDVRRVRVLDVGSVNSRLEDSYRVVPRVIAASIVSDVYFAGRATPVRIRDIQAALPELKAGVLQTQIYAKLLGAAEPVLPTTAELLEVLPAVESSSQRDELLRTYALLSPDCGRFVIDYLAKVIRDAAESDDEGAAADATRVLAARVAEALQQDNSDPVGALFDALELLASRDWDYTTPLKAIVEEVQDARTGDTPTATGIVNLAAALSSESAQRLPTQVWLELAAEVLQPTFDGNYMSPEIANQFVMQSFTWPAEDMDAMFDSLQAELTERIAHCSNADLEALIEFVSRWVGIANGYSLPYGGRPNEAQKTSAHRIAHSVASTMAPRIAAPGIRVSFNRVVSELDIKLDEPDELFAALTAARDHSEDWEADRRRMEAELDAALDGYVQKPPELLMGWIVEHEADLATVKNGTAGWQVMSRLAMRPDPEIWLQAALDHGLARTASPLVNRCVDLGLLTVPMATALMQDAGGRTALVPAIISACNDADLVTMVVSDLKVQDVQDLDSSYAIRHASESTRQALFTHPDPMIRSNAAALWAAECSYDPDGMAEDPNWITAMSDLVVPSLSMRNYMQSRALNVLVKTAPAPYMNLMVKHVDALEGIDDFDEWEESARQLSDADRADLWNRVRNSPMAKNLFWIIAAGDVDWITTAVAEPDFPVSLSQLLQATRFQFGKRYALRTLAEMLRPLNWQPDDLLWTLEVGTHTGEDHERIARHVEICRALEASPEPDLARLGARGVEIYEPRLIEARAAARRAAVRGNLGY